MLRFTSGCLVVRNIITNSEKVADLESVNKYTNYIKKQGLYNSTILRCIISGESI